MRFLGDMDNEFAYKQLGQIPNTYFDKSLPMRFHIVLKTETFMEFIHNSDTKLSQFMYSINNWRRCWWQSSSIANEMDSFLFLLSCDEWFSHLAFDFIIDGHIHLVFCPSFLRSYELFLRFAFVSVSSVFRLRVSIFLDRSAIRLPFAKTAENGCCVHAKRANLDGLASEIRL